MSLTPLLQMNDVALFVWFAGAGLGVIVVAAVPDLIRVRFPSVYRGPVVWLDDRFGRRRYPIGARIAGLITALVVLVALQSLFPDSFGGPGLSFGAAIVIGLAIQLSFTVWRRAWSFRALNRADQSSRRH